MRTTVTDKTGVEMAGPDTPGLAAAEAREGNQVDVVETRLVTERAPLLGASAGSVAPEQAGILPMRGLQVTENMVDGAVNAAARLGRSLDPSEARAILEASLRAR
jgi:hypothetical protein